MKIVVSNTSPLRYLTQIGESEVLYQLFGKLFIPQAVFEELTHHHTPMVVRQWIQNSPIWLQVAKVTLTEDISLQHLDRGERQAILLAKQMPADLLLIDDKAGRMTAKEHSLTLMGTLGILELAEIQGQIDLSKVLQKLLQTNIKLSPSLRCLD